MYYLLRKKMDILISSGKVNIEPQSTQRTQRTQSFAFFSVSSVLSVVFLQDGLSLEIESSSIVHSVRGQYNGIRIAWMHADP
jgi:hypothetical protein